MERRRTRSQGQQQRTPHIPFNHDQGIEGRRLDLCDESRSELKRRKNGRRRTLQQIEAHGSATKKLRSSDVSSNSSNERLAAGVEVKEKQGHEDPGMSLALGIEAQENEKHQNTDSEEMVGPTPKSSNTSHDSLTSSRLSSSNLERTIFGPEATPSSFSLGFMCEQWLIRKETELFGSNLINIIGCESFLELQKYLFGINYEETPSKVYSFLQKSFEGRISFEVVAFIVLYYLKGCRIEKALELNNLVKNNGTIPFESLIHHTVVYRLKEMDVFERNKLIEKDLISNGLYNSLIGRDLVFMYGGKQSAHLKIAQIILRNTYATSETITFLTDSFSNADRTAFVKEMIKLTMKHLGDLSYTLRDCILLTNQKLGLGTSNFLSVTVAGKTRDIQFNQKAVSTICGNDVNPRLNVNIATSDVTIQKFIEMIYGYNRIYCEPEHITPSLINLIVGMGIPNPLKILFKPDFLIRTYYGQNKAYLVYVIVTLGAPKENALFDEIVGHFKEVLPSVLRNKFLKEMNAAEMKKFIGQVDLNIDILEKYYLVVKWAYVQCDEVWDEGDYPVYMSYVKNKFRQVVGSLPINQLFPFRQLILPDRFIFESDFNE